MDEQVQRALEQVGVIDITTRGRTTGQPHRIEIRFHHIALLPTSMRESRCSLAYSHPDSCKETDDVEALMQIDTLLHTEHPLDPCAGQFAHWRQRRAQL